MVIPSFKASQTTSHVVLVIAIEACDEGCRHRAVVDAGSTFGIACNHFHLPLVFPDATLVDGRSKLGEEEDDVIKLRREGSILHVTLLKREQGKDVPGLEDLQASVFPLLEDDEEGQHEERLFGLDMLQRGLQSMKSADAAGETLKEVQTATPSSSASAKASTSRLPQPPNVPKTARTKVHEYFSDSNDHKDDSSRQRLLAAQQAEDTRWDEGMYLDNFVDEEGEVKYLIEAKLKRVAGSESRGKRTKADIQLSTSQGEDLHLLLLDLLLAHAYDYRTTLGDPTVESAWTIAVLCRSLVGAYLPSSINNDTVRSVLVGSLRRQLTLPLYRSWALSVQIARDVIAILRDQQSILPILSSMQRLLEESEDEAMPIYTTEVLSPLVDLSDTVFSDTSLRRLAGRLDEAINFVTKNSISDAWDIEALEDAAREAIREGQGGYV